jgi:hypothetical protein
LVKQSHIDGAEEELPIKAIEKIAIKKSDNVVFIVD